MKTTFFLCAALALGLVSCTDTVEPTVDLQGGNTMEHPLNEPYTDPGFTADDDTDGDISGSVTVAGEVDVDLVGDYSLVYSVEDEAGNAASAASRTVQVRNDADHLDGMYFISANQLYGTSTGTSTSGTPASDEITASTTLNNRFFFDAFPVYGMLNADNSIEIPQQGAPGDAWSGTGTVDASGDMIIQLIHSNSWGGQSQFELFYTKR